jgi:hypothetical protein
MSGKSQSPVPEPSMRISMELQVSTIAKVDLAVTRIMLRTNKRISRQALIDKVLEMSDLGPAIEEFAK